MTTVEEAVVMVMGGEEAKAVIMAVVVMEAAAVVMEVGMTTTVVVMAAVMEEVDHVEVMVDMVAVEVAEGTTNDPEVLYVDQRFVHVISDSLKADFTNTKVNLTLWAKEVD